MIHLQRLLGAGLALLLAVSVSGAQQEHGGRPPSLAPGRGPLREVPTARMRPVDARLLLEEDAARVGPDGSRDGALRFGESLEVELGLADGVWEELGGGDRVWRLRIASPGARSLALVFRRYQLPEGGELYVYDDARETVRGAYTDLENRLDGEFAIRPLRGDALTLEYYEPARARGRGELELAAVVHDYRGVLGLIGDRTGGAGGGASSCQVDVACPQAAPYAAQVDAAVHVVSLPSGLLCSGSLLNNTAGDGTILVLSAAHCSDLSNAVFTFNFQCSGCGTGTAPTTHTIVGSTPLAADGVLDVQLVRLNVPQGPQPFPVFLAGWDRSDATPGRTALIHHPAGDVKKITLDNNAPVKSGNFWRILAWEVGVSQGGSSGAPLFAASGRFVGNLDSGASRCGVPNNDFATRLAVAWPLVEPYLDPLGTGQLTLDGLDLATTTPRAFAVGGIFPTQVESLVPGIDRTVRVLGAGFDDTLTLDLNGAPLDTARYLRGGHSFVNVDLPQLPIGPHLLTVHQGGASVDVPFDIVAPALPRFQVNDGQDFGPLFSSQGIDTLHADQPGHIHYCFWSTSSTPSVHPLLTLDLGNGFSELGRCRLAPIPPQGWTQVHHPLPPGIFAAQQRIWSQTACISHGIPFATSNRQVNDFQF